MIKPLKALTVPTKKGLIRPIFKRKIAEFTEDRRFHQAQKWSSPASAFQPTSLDLLKWEAFHHLTENRLRSAISKLGYRGRHESSKSRQLFQLFIADVLEQLDLSQHALLTELTPAEKRELIAAIQQETRPLVKRFFQQESRRV